MPLTLHVEIDAETGQFKGGIKGAEGELKKFGDQGEQAGRRLRRAFDDMSGAINRAGRRLALALTGATAALVLLSRRSIATADELGKTADRIGLTVEGLQELRFAAQHTGVDLEVFNQGLTAMVRRAGEAQRGNEEFAKAFDAVGLSAENLRRLQPEEILRRVADGLARIPNEQEQVALADRIFSEAGRRMINVLRLQSRGLDDMAARAHQLGIVLSEDMVRRAEQANDELSDMSEVFRVAGLNLGLNLMPAMRELARVLTDPAVIRGARDLGFAMRDLVKWSTENSDTLLRIIGALVGLQLGSKFGPRGAIVGVLLGAGFTPEALKMLGAELKGVDETLGQIEKRGGAFSGGGLVGDVGGGGVTGAALEKMRKSIADVRFEAKLMATGVSEATQEAARAARAAGIVETFEEIKGSAGQVQQNILAFANAFDVLKQQQGLATLRGQVADLRFEADLLAAGLPKGLEEAARAARGAGLIETFEGLKTASREAGSALAAYFDQFQRLGELRRAKEVFDQTRTPLEAYNAKLAELRRLLDDAAISQDTFNRAVAAAKDELKDASKDANEDQQKLNQAADRFAFSITSAFEDAIVGGQGLRAVFQGLLEDIERMIIQLIVLEPLGRSLRGGFRGVAAGGGFEGFLTGFFAKQGGVVGRDRFPLKLVPASAFAGAPHFQAGGIVGGGVPAIVHRGEEILPPSHPRHINNAGGVEVNVYAPPGTQPRVDRRRGPRGQLQVDVIFDEGVANAVRQPGSKTRAAISQTFGIQHQLIARG